MYEFNSSVFLNYAIIISIDYQEKKCKNLIELKTIPNSMENDNSTSAIPEDYPRIYQITYILLLIVEIPAIICTFLILIFFSVNWHSIMSRVLHNHAIFLLMVVSSLYIILDLPFIISYYRLGYDLYHTQSFCVYWYWLDYTLITLSLFLTATASVQRHILVFNGRWLQGPRQRWILHYMPLGFCILYPTVFYLSVIVFYSCPAIDEIYCSFPCYSNDFVLFYFDWIFNVIFPVFLIITANVLLIFRAIYSMDKFLHSQTCTWKKRRKLILQLLAFSILYAIGWGPSTIISIIHTLFLPDLYIDAPNFYYINNSSYFVCPLQPFICLFALPQLLKFMKRKIRERRSAVNGIVSVLGNTIM